MAGSLCRRNRPDLSPFLARFDVSRHRAQCLDRNLGRTVEAALQIDCTGTSGDVPHAVGEDRLSQNGRGARAVAYGLPGLDGGLPEHLRTEVFLGILEVDLLGDRHPVIANDR